MLAHLLCLVLLTCAAGRPGVPAERLARLARGVNMSHWYWIPHDASEAGEVRAVQVADVEMLKAAGITHVRIPVEPDYIWDAEADTLRQDRLARYRRGVSLFTDRGIAVVVEPHPSRTPWAKLKDPGFADEFDALWKSLAAAMADTDPELVFLEIMNEPHDAPDAKSWASLQARVARTIRAAAPRHTIIATNNDWSSPEAITRLEPLEDRNVVYTFHFYEPHTFTHQGASWGAPNWVNLKNIPYPGTPETIKACLEGMNDAGKREARWYADQRWDRAKVGGMIAKAAAWGKEHGVPLWCGEFGAFRDTTPTDSRERWLRDVTGALREHSIGWCVWDYAGGFSLVEGEPGSRSLRADTARAIGLTSAPE